MQHMAVRPSSMIAIRMTQGKDMKNTPTLYIVGLGSQAKAWALNLRDSGVDVVIGLREQSPSLKKAQELGFKTTILKANDSHFFEGSPLIALLIPDHEMIHFFECYPQASNKNCSYLLAHGASYPELLARHPDLKLGLLAPKAIASEVRFRFETKGALGAAIAQGTLESNTYAQVPRLCQALGINAGPYEVSIAAETAADLFSEQSLLCGLLPYALRASFETLVAKGIPEELAFMECWVEAELIMKTLCEKGPMDFFSLISPAALAGASKASKVLVDQSFKDKLERLWQEIESNEFIGEVQKTNMLELREQIKKDWERSPLSLAHARLKSQFYP